MAAENCFMPRYPTTDPVGYSDTSLSEEKCDNLSGKHTMWHRQMVRLRTLIPAIVGSTLAATTNSPWTHASICVEVGWCTRS